MPKKLTFKPALATSVADHNARLKIVATTSLRFRKGDPRRFSAADLALAADVLQRLPSNAPFPIIVNALDEVLVGHLFVHTAQKIGLERIAVIADTGLSEIDQKRYSVAITQLLTKGAWDPIDLGAWVRELETTLEDFSHLGLGFANGELDRALGLAGLSGADANREANLVPPLAQTAISQPGSLWMLGNHRLLVGDATRAADFDRLMAGQRAHHAISDPPFGCKIDGFVSRKGLHRDFVEAAGEKSREELRAFFLAFTQNVANALIPGALVHLFIDWRSLDLLLSACESAFGNLLQLCCWVKDRAGMGSLYRSRHELVLVYRAPGGKHHNNVLLGRNGRNRSNVWEYPGAASSRTGREGDMLKHHPTPKSVEMIADAILDCTEHGNAVLDCFLGSGTALIAAERTGRVCYGMELDPRYADVAIRRWQKWTGHHAVNAESGKTFDDIAAAAEQPDGENPDA